MYAAIVWAVLLSCITSPFMLLILIKYFNKKQLIYLADTNPLKLAKNSSGHTPLFLHVKSTSPAFGGMQEKFRKIVNELGLEVVERRTNRSGRGLDATVQTDLYVRDTTMEVPLQRLKAQRKIKNALKHIIDENPDAIAQTLDHHTRRISSNHLSNLSLASLGQEEKEVVQEAAKELDVIIQRADHVEKVTKEALGEGTNVIVEVWNPWPWTDVLDSICTHYELTGNGSENIETFVAIFDKIDIDGSGDIDEEELYDALGNAGLDITEEGVTTLVGMIDEDGNGEIDRGEWKEAIEFYLELKEEMFNMQNQNVDHASFLKDLRAKKLEALSGKDPPKTATPTIKEEGSQDKEFGAEIGMDIGM